MTARLSNGNRRHTVQVAEIVVIVEGGVVQEVTGIPEGVTVAIHDYDATT